MTTPPKHAAIIKQWADGAQIQFKWDAHTRFPDAWSDVKQPTWRSDCDYRVKPWMGKPDVVQTFYANGFDNLIYRSYFSREPVNLRLTFDGDTMKLKKAEVI